MAGAITGQLDVETRVLAAFVEDQLRRTNFAP
jgi:hypothetical protein